MPSDKVYDEDWLEGSSKDLAIPESPFIDMKKPMLRALPRNSHYLQGNMILGVMTCMFLLSSVTLFITFGVLFG